MALAPRRREALHVAAVYRHHPLFAGGDVDMPDFAAPLEGGDVLLASDVVVLVGVGERTRAAGVERLASELFERGDASELIVVALPRRRAVMHLDTVLTMLDRDAVTLWPPIASASAFRLRPTRFGVRVDEEPDLPAALARAAGVERMRVVETGGDELAGPGEQWHDANNLLALAPGVVVGYDRNVETNARLRDAGFQVLTVPGGELGRGRGGARCMSCPIARDPLV
jgi:arginine deiminase